MPLQQLLPFGDEEKSTSRLIVELGKVCAESPLEEKVLVAPTLAIGHQTVERLALSGTRWVNLRVETVRNLAHAFVGPELANEGVRLLSRAQALALVEQACAETLTERSYFGELRDRPGLHRALQATFDDLRAAGISAASLPASAFADRKKASEIKAILARYESLLEEGKFVDRAEVLRRAASSAEKKPPLPSGVIYLLPEGNELSAVEKSFLGRLAAGGVRVLPTDPAEEWKRTAKEALLYAALGEENEIREVFRALLAGKIQFDEAELLHTDATVYPALVYELASQYGVPCTFAGGIAATFTRPGQAAQAFLDWLAGGYEAEALRHALSSGAVTLKTLAPEERVGRTAAARALRDATIGWGRDRHITCLDKLIAARSRPPDARHADRDEDDSDRAAREERRTRRLAAALLARDFVREALELAPEGSGDDVDLQALARGAREFVVRFGRVASDLDATAGAALVGLFTEFETLPPLRLPPAQGVGRLAEAVRALHVAADRPRPGRLHVAEYRSGGWSGRVNTFLVGLDKARHPGTDLEDPVLLDEERRSINRALSSGELPLWRDRPREKTRELELLLARLRGKFAASYSRWDLSNLTQPGEKFPAPFFLEIYRQKSRRADADYSDLSSALPRAAGFLPGEEAALDAVEWWLSRLDSSAPRGGSAAPVVRAFYPWLADGHRAEQERDSERFTEFDGWVKARPEEIDPRINREPISCSRIQTLATCPYMYFAKHVLKIEPPEELDRDATRWLDPMEAGLLLHDVFRRFFDEITRRGDKPVYERDLPLLETYAQEEIDRWSERVPPRSELAFGGRREEILFACRTFLRLEEEHCRDLAPRFFEVPFGLPRLPSLAGIGSPDPVEISLGRGGSFLLRGCIDRIDEAADGTFQVWDYKTGSSYGVREELGLRDGRQVQHALYAMALEELLARAGRPGRVSRSGYFFPGRKGQGQRFALPLEPEETRKVLNALFDLLKDGAFAHTPKEDDCRFCDYKTVCGGVERATERARAKNLEVAPPVLRDFWGRRGA